MPEYDLGEIARRLAEGQTISEIGAELDGPPGPTAEEQAAAQGRRDLQQARGALNAEAAPPGQEPDTDPIDAAFRAADESGYQRGSDMRMATYVDGIFRAAKAGDPRVMTQGVPDQETRERWHEAAHKRQISNRDASSMRHR